MGWRMSRNANGPFQRPMSSVHTRVSISFIVFDPASCARAALAPHRFQSSGRHPPDPPVDRRGLRRSTFCRHFFPFLGCQLPAWVFPRKIFDWCARPCRKREAAPQDRATRPLLPPSAVLLQNGNEQSPVFSCAPLSLPVHREFSMRNCVACPRRYPISLSVRLCRVLGKAE